MNQQTLERLMMDDALDTLSPDVKDLLNAYTAPVGAAGELAVWAKLAASAGEAMHEDAHNNPATSALPIRLLRSARFWHRAQFGFAAAALMALGIAIGICVPLSMEQRREPIASIAPLPQPVVKPESTVAPTTGFWSSQRLLAVALESKRSAAPAPQWNWISGEPYSDQMKSNGETK